MAAPERRRANVTSAFGGPVQIFSASAGEGFPMTSAHADMDRVRRTLQGFNGGGAGFLRIYRPYPTAAFSPRDTTLENYAAAADAMRARGFEPVERRAGGQLAVYDSHALVVDLAAPHGEPRAEVQERFKLFSGVIAQAFISLGIDARVGAIGGEYCPGDYSVNGEGRIKLAGIAQRIARRGYHLGAVISVMPSGRAIAAATEAYRILGYSCDPATFGALAGLVPGLSFAKLGERLHDALAEILLEGELVRMEFCETV